jgi:hypothetical protein
MITMINTESMEAFMMRNKGHTFEYGVGLQEHVNLVVRLYRPDIPCTLTLEITFREKELKELSKVRGDWGRVLIENSERLNNIQVLHVVHRWPNL